LDDEVRVAKMLAELLKSLVKTDCFFRTNVVLLSEKLFLVFSQFGGKAHEHGS
jgi:hypothetical protein